MTKPSKEESYRIAHNIKKMRELKGFNQKHNGQGAWHPPEHIQPYRIGRDTPQVMNVWKK